MRHRWIRRAAVGAAVLLAPSCVTLTPEESCTAICEELYDCGFALPNSTLSSGSSCEADCLGKIGAGGNACKSAAAYLGDCFQTYTCVGSEYECQTNASVFSDDCG